MESLIEQMFLKRQEIEASNADIAVHEDALKLLRNKRKRLHEELQQLEAQGLNTGNRGAIFATVDDFKQAPPQSAFISGDGYRLMYETPNGKYWVTGKNTPVSLEDAITLEPSGYYLLREHPANTTGYVTYTTVPSLQVLLEGTRIRGLDGMLAVAIKIGPDTWEVPGEGHQSTERLFWYDSNFVQLITVPQHTSLRNKRTQDVIARARQTSKDITQFLERRAVERERNGRELVALGLLPRSALNEFKSTKGKS